MAKLAGTRGYCLDALDVGGSGPQLVVIAAAGGQAMFAIARNETSVSEYAKFCTAANACALPAGLKPENPVTNVSLQDAKNYAGWLSRNTGKTYRLPTEAEWLRAAGTEKDVNSTNCVVMNAGKVMRGNELSPANQSGSNGGLNAQGLRHFFGNVQEWAGSDDAHWKAMGGAIGDLMDDCSEKSAKQHDGKPDRKTGFRLVRQMP